MSALPSQEIKGGGSSESEKGDTWSLSPSLPQEAEHGPESTMWVMKPQKAGSVPRLEPQEPYRNHIRATTAPPAHRDFRCCLFQAKASTDLLTVVLLWLAAEAGSQPPHSKDPKAPAPVVLSS